MKGRRGIRRRQLLDDLKETTGYWKPKEEALYPWGTRFARDYGPVGTAAYNNNNNYYYYTTVIFTTF